MILTPKTPLQFLVSITYAALLVIQGGVLYTLQTAAVAGEKRLSSETYKKLNLGTIMGSFCALAGFFWAAKMECRVVWVILTLGTYNLVQLSASAFGYYKGYTYK